VQPSVSLIMELFQEGAAPACLEQACAEVEAYGRDAELVLVYDPADADLPALRAAAAGVRHRFVAAPGRRYYEMKNDGAASSSSDVLVFLDSDTEADPGFLRALVEPLEEQGVVVVSCVTTVGPVRKRMDRLYASYWMFPAPEPPGPPFRFNRFMANGFAIRRSDFQRFGPFPEDSRSRGQCRSLAAVIMASGGLIMRAPNSRFQHPPPYQEGFIGQAMRRGRDLQMSSDLGVVDWPGSGRRWLDAAVEYARDVRDRAQALGCNRVDASLAVGMAVADMGLVLAGARLARHAPRFSARFHK
jgi:hypothetical protein